MAVLSLPIVISVLLHKGDLYSWAFERNASDGKTYLMIGPNGTTENRSSFRPAN